MPGKAKAEHSVVQRWSGVIWPPLFACKQIPRHKTKFSIHHNSIIRQTLSWKHIFRSASSGVASTVSSRRWRSTRQRRGTLGSTSATLTTSNLSLFNSYIAQSLIHLLFEQKCPLPCTVIQVLDRHAILPVRLQILN